MWIDETAYERAARLDEGRAPDLLAPNGTPPDPRSDWLTRLCEVYSGGCRPVLDTWAAVSQRLGARECRVETATSRVRAFGLLAGGVADGWLPVLLVDLNSGEGWRVVLTAHAVNVVRW